MSMRTRPDWRLLALLLFLAAPAQALDPAPEVTTAAVAKAPVTASQFMIAAANPLAAKAGYDILAAGGTAVDAAIAVQLVLNVVEPQSSGIGGGAFMLHWDARSRTLDAIDGRETAPAAIGPDWFLGPDGKPLEFWDALVGGRSVAVPGTVRLLELAHVAHGTTSWSDLFQPAIRLAENGFPVSARMAAAIASAAEHGLADFPATKALFFTADGQPLPAGTIFRNPELAATLRLIATEGADAFYRGELAQRIVTAVNEAPISQGRMTLEDLASYAAVMREPVCVDYRGNRVCGMGPPSSGGLAVGQILGILQQVDMPGLGPTADGIHMLLEASRLAYADRDVYVADSDKVRVPTSGLLDPTYLLLRAQQLRLDSSIGKAVAGNPPWREALELAPDQSEERPGTSHFSIVDQDGNAVSMTTTIETGMGSRVLVGGFLLNNELTDFSFVPEQNGRPVANRVEGGKRPRSSMAPTIVLNGDGQPMLLLGSPGGSRIISFVAQALVAMLDWGMDPQTAVAMGHAVNRNGDSELEKGTDVAAFQASLEARGQTVQLKDEDSGLHVIMMGNGVLRGGADPRREGVALGD